MWKEKCDWDDTVPQRSLAVWQQWCSEFHVLLERKLPWRYFPKYFDITPIELHGFCDAPESAYAGVVYIRATKVDSCIHHTALVIAKTKVASIKHLSISQLKLRSALLVTKLLLHCGKILGVSLESIYTWTDSTVVLS